MSMSPFPSLLPILTDDAAPRKQNVLLQQSPPLPLLPAPSRRGNRILVVCAMWTKHHSVYRNFQAYVEALKRDFEVGYGGARRVPFYVCCCRWRHTLVFVGRVVVQCLACNAKWSWLARVQRGRGLFCGACAWLGPCFCRLVLPNTFRFYFFSLSSSSPQVTLYIFQNDLVKASDSVDVLDGFKDVQYLRSHSHEDAVAAARWVHDQAFDAIFYPEVLVTPS
jgi:hypothetical protein